ncbi:hypothetical protein BsWGS_20729 [Bradybaena similaris]
MAKARVAAAAVVVVPVLVVCALLLVNNMGSSLSQYNPSSIFRFTSIDPQAEAKSQIHRITTIGPQTEANSQIHRITTIDPQTEANSLKYRKQRDDLSRQLNLMKKLYGQLNCENLSLRRSKNEQVDDRVSENGGWCGNTSSSTSLEHVWDEPFSKAMSTFLEGKCVASFGEGPGLYKKHMDSLGQVANYTAYDGAPLSENITNGLVMFLDLTAPQYGLPVYDWVISVEVGEHIPAKYEDVYLDNLVRHAKEGIILSWAVPGQKGLSHVNNKPPEEVLAQMVKRGFTIDKEHGEQLRNAATSEWLRRNVNVYRRQNVDSFREEDA